MEQYSPDSFARHSQHVRNPISSRRKRRLLRLALGCAAVTAAAVALLAVALSGA
jgi:hypothetical protein